MWGAWDKDGGWREAEEGARRWCGEAAHSWGWAGLGCGVERQCTAHGNSVSSSGLS